MKLAKLIDDYVTYKRALGMRFNTETHILASFCRYFGADRTVSSITHDDVQAYLDGDKPISSYWQRQYTALSGFYRFALSRGYVQVLPLPRQHPKFPPPLVPYIYSRAELKSLLNATPYVCGKRVSFDAQIFRHLILLLYGACLRVSEGIHLTMKDVDLDQAVLCIRDSKFYKTRLVPLGTHLNDAMNQYARQWRSTQFNEPDAPFFCFRDGRALSYSAVASGFRRLRVRASVKRHISARYQPRLHDLRHTGVVHRVIAWYQQGEDLAYLLPQLATYLGHVDLSSTQKYLTLTPELLYEANQRFEDYAMGVHHG